LLRVASRLAIPEHTFKEEAAMTMSDELGKLEELRQRGVLTDEEFARAKARVLGESPRPAGPPGVAAINALRRSRGDRWLAGVCGGLARSTGMDSWVWRLLFTVLALLGGAGVLLYILLWVFVPNE
jgi:phage shock protein C